MLRTSRRDSSDAQGAPPKRFSHGALDRPCHGFDIRPGVAACEANFADAARVCDYNAGGNLMAVISNDTAVLGLGNIEPLASRPVMEGKAVGFKKFAGIDLFNLEIDANDVDRFCDVVAAPEPTFGGIKQAALRKLTWSGTPFEMNARYISLALMADMVDTLHEVGPDHGVVDIR